MTSGAQLFRSVKWTDDEDRKLLDMVEAGKSWVLISLALKRSRMSVQARVRMLVKRKQDDSK